MKKSMGFVSLVVLALGAAACSSGTGGANAGASQTTSGQSVSQGSIISALTSDVQSQITGTGKDQFDAKGVSSVSCTPPSRWTSGATFTCYAYDSGGTELGEYDATLESGSGTGPAGWSWNAQWKPSAAESTEEAAGDVTITSCQPNQYVPTIIDVTGTIVNHDTQADNYSIQVTLLSGSTRVGEADDYESNIASGQTSTWSTEGQTTGATGTVTCELGAVSRTPSS